MLEVIFFLAIYQASIIISLMVGMKGQGRYKQAMGELQSIARDKSLTVDEREHMLVMQIHHQFLELGHIYVERNKKYGLNYFTKKKKEKKIVTKNPSLEGKKTKKLGVKKRVKIDEVVWKQIGYLIVGVWGFLGIALLDGLLHLWMFSPFWILTITGIWYCIDAFILFYIHYVFNIEPINEVQTPI